MFNLTSSAEFSTGLFGLTNSTDNSTLTSEQLNDLITSDPNSIGNISISDNATSQFNLGGTGSGVNLG